jgi:hypothetical protein
VNATDQEAKAIRAWILDLLHKTGLKPTPFAKEVGLAPSTLMRAISETNPTSLERRSIKKIVEKYNVQWPQLSGGQPTGFGEPELLDFHLDAPLFGGMPLEANQYVKEVNTRAVELLGYLPRDRVLFDMSSTPTAGDVVQAQVYSLVSREAETVLRYYDPPYLVMRTTDPSLSQKPLPVDGERVKIMAVAVKMIRERDRD